jgi:hypothetical protein
MYREDLFYADAQFTCWTTNLNGKGKETMELFTDKFLRLYPGYLLDKEMHIRAKPETKVINLQTLLSVLRSSDEQVWKENHWMFDGEFKFMDNEPNKSNKIAFASFPRSGNTFLRKFSELLTGVQTGADNTLHISIML